MNVKQVLIPIDRLSVTEHIQIFCDVRNFPMEIQLDRTASLVHQNEVYNLLLNAVPFSIDAGLMAALIQGSVTVPPPEPEGELVVLDAYNCYVKQGEYWHPYRPYFSSRTRGVHFFSHGGYIADLEHPIRWATLARFLRTFHPHRRKFALYHHVWPQENYYCYLKSLYVEFQSIPSNELETLGESRRTRLRARDELARRRVLSLRA